MGGGEVGGGEGGVCVWGGEEEKTVNEPRRRLNQT